MIVRYSFFNIYIKWKQHKGNIFNFYSSFRTSVYMNMCRFFYFCLQDDLNKLEQMRQKAGKDRNARKHHWNYWSSHKLTGDGDYNSVWQNASITGKDEHIFQHVGNCLRKCADRVSFSRTRVNQHFINFINETENCITKEAFSVGRVSRWSLADALKSPKVHKSTTCEALEHRRRVKESHAFFKIASA